MPAARRPRSARSSSRSTRQPRRPDPPRRDRPLPPRDRRADRYMDGRLITEMRTAAASAVATRYLARPEASVLASSAPACRRTATSRRCGSCARSTTCASGARAARQRSPTGSRRARGGIGRGRGARRGRRARGHDVADAGAARRWLMPGAHVNAVGAAAPTGASCTTSWCARRGCSSTRARRRCASRATSSRRARADGARRGDRRHAARAQTRSEITLFKSVGVAVEDVVTADLVYRKASRPPA